MRKCEPAQRVQDITSADIPYRPIFFITSYWSDFILVPLKARATVIHALEDRGFLFESDSEDLNGFGASTMTNPASPLLHPNHRNGSSMSSFDFPPQPPSTPPPATVSELQLRTFALLKTHSITPHVDPDIQLVTCAGIKDSTPSSEPTQSILQHALLTTLTSPSAPPTFLSLTLTATDSPSLTLETSLLPLFPDTVLLGKEGPVQVPITLDLSQLPLQSTGIVCGVAAGLVEGMKGKVGMGGAPGFEMSYLSTARAGHVIVYEEELEDAVGVLRGLGKE